MPTIHVLDHSAVLAPVTPQAAIDAVREAFLRHHRGEWVMPPKVYLDGIEFVIQTDSARRADQLLAGELEEAVALFTRSLQLKPTAEAYTFRGWAYSFAGRLEEAIEECGHARIVFSRIACDAGARSKLRG